MTQKTELPILGSHSRQVIKRGRVPFTLLCLGVLVFSGCSAFFEDKATRNDELQEQGFFALTVKSLTGEPAALSQYAGQVVLVVNVASECGLTPQYEGLQSLHERYRGQGLVVLGFPSNEFGGQEPGTAEEIANFCSSQFNVTFPMFEKCETKEGPGQSPVYRLLGGATGSLPGWNFGKYLVSRDGKQATFFDSRTAPLDPDLMTAIQQELDA